MEVVLRRVDEAEVDEMWSFVGKKKEPRWLWHAIDHRTGKVLAYVFGRRTDEVFVKLKRLLEPFGITRYYTDYWGAYSGISRLMSTSPGKRNTQHIERKHLTLRTRIKRLVRKTICFSKSIEMHDIVIGLFINRYEFGCPCKDESQICNTTLHIYGVHVHDGLTSNPTKSLPVHVPNVRRQSAFDAAAVIPLPSTPLQTPLRASSAASVGALPTLAAHKSPATSYSD